MFRNFLLFPYVFLRRVGSCSLNVFGPSSLYLYIDLAFGSNQNCFRDRCHQDLEILSSVGDAML